MAWIESGTGRQAVAIEATTGWRWIARELQARVVEVRLTDAGQASACRGAEAPRPTGSTLAGWWCCWPARCCPAHGWHRRTFSGCVTRRGCARRDGRSHPLGAAAARGARSRGLAVLARIAVDERGGGGSRRSGCTRRPRPDRHDACRDGAGRDRSPHRLRLHQMAKTTRACGRAADLRDRADPRATILAEIGDANGSAAPARSSAPPAWTRSSASRPTSTAAASSPSRARRTCAGRSSRPLNTRAARPAPTTSSTSATTAMPAPTPPPPHRPQDRQARLPRLARARRHQRLPGQRPQGRPPSRMTTGRGEPCS